MGDSGIMRMKRLSADIRIHTVKALGQAGFGHIGGSASIADVLGVLYGGVMNVRPDDPQWEERDRLVISKGHSGPALYAALALRGFFPLDWLATINRPGTRLPSHCDMRRTPGVDMSTGSLGQGVSAAVGIALANRLLGRESYTYCILGDGELNEGQVWEAVQTAAHHGLDRLIILIDWNKKQLDGTLDQVCRPFDIHAKFETFGLHTQTVCGWDAQAICDGIAAAKSARGKASAILLDTVKGLGISFAERAGFNHFMNMDAAMADEAAAEIERRWEAGTYPTGGGSDAQAF